MAFSGHLELMKNRWGSWMRSLNGFQLSIEDSRFAGLGPTFNSIFHQYLDVAVIPCWRFFWTLVVRRLTLIEAIEEEIDSIIGASGNSTPRNDQHLVWEILCGRFDVIGKGVTSHLV